MSWESFDLPLKKVTFLWLCGWFSVQLYKIEQAEICQFSYQPKTTQLQDQKILLNFIQYALMKSSHICTPPITLLRLIHYKVYGANLDSVFPFHICTPPMNPPPHAMCTCTHILHLSMSKPNKPRSFKPCWTFLDFWERMCYPCMHVAPKDEMGPLGMDS